MIRDFAKNVLTFEATANGKPVHTTKLDKQTWQCDPVDGELKICILVYAWDLSVRSAHFDGTHAFFNGTSLFLQVKGQEESACFVEIIKPDPNLPNANIDEDWSMWRVATAMNPVETDGQGFGIYEAENYVELVDHPFEIGSFDVAQFEVFGAPHEIVLTGRHEADLERLCSDLKKICEHHVRFFADPKTPEAELKPPMDRYLFLTMVVGDGYGGLEHRASTALLCSRDDLPRKCEKEVSDNYRKFLGLCSHEYFHFWNVKRICPEAFAPCSLDQEAYTRQLWAFEGITSYYDDLSLVQTGLISKESYLELLGQMLTRLQRTLGRKRQTVTESSLDAWAKFYKQDENAQNAIVSYYTKGAVVALLLDLHLRRASNGEQSLQNVMRHLWQEYGQACVGLPEERIEQICTETGGESIRPFLHQALHTTEELELKEILMQFGLEVCTRPARSASDQGGNAASEKNLPKSWLGIATATHAQGVKITRIVEGSPAQQAGLSAGDIIIAINHLQVDPEKLQKRLRQTRPGAHWEIHAFRRDELMQFSITLSAPPNDTVFLRLLENAPYPFPFYPEDRLANESENALKNW